MTWLLVAALVAGLLVWDFGENMLSDCVGTSLFVFTFGMFLKEVRGPA